MTGPVPAASVLDASAVLAWMYGEPGAKEVEAALDGGHMSLVNLAEVTTKAVERGASAARVRQDLAAYGARFHDFDAEQADRCAELRLQTRAAGLSLGDRACLALAQTLALPALTADRAWGGLEVGVSITIIR